MKRLAVVRAAVGLFAPLAVLGCGGPGPPAPDVVARVEDRQLPYAEFESYLRRNSLATEVALSSEVLSGLFDQYLDEVLLEQLASERGLSNADGDRTRAIEALVESSLPVGFSEDEVGGYYARHRSDFEREETVVVRQILVERRQRAEEARASIAAGGSFDEIARELSQGPGASQGGFQGELSRADLPSAFADVIFALEPGEVSEIVAADYGFHLFQVIERRPSASFDLSEARETIHVRLLAEARGQVLSRLVEQARSSYNTEVYARNLPFNYVGSYN